MFRRLPESLLNAAPAVTVYIDGRPFVARAGDSVAAAVLASGRAACRTTAVSGSPRGPFCLMGACFDCLVVVDGRANQQGCLVPVAEGMEVETQRGARESGVSRKGRPEREPPSAQREARQDGPRT
jgi:predicted molibdopterin-dependent oxidoreductase YjgC